MSEIEQNTEEEISLIDLFAVIIKFRKMIILGTAIVSFLAGLYIFVLPVAVPSMNKKEIDVTYSVKINPLPRSINTGLSNLGISASPEKVLTSSFVNLPFISKKYKDTPFMGNLYPTDTSSYNAFISDLVKNKNISTKAAIMVNTYDVKIRMPVNNVETGTKFVENIISVDNETIKKEINDALPLLEKNTKESLAKIEKSSGQVNDLSTIQFLRDVLNDIKTYNEKTEPVFQLTEEPFVLSIAQGRVKKLAIAMFAAFFVFVFVAFARNAIQNIKADPEASKTLSDAWESGK